MKSHIFSLSFLILVCLGMVACTEHEASGLEQTQCMQLTVSCTHVDIARSAGTKPGERDYNENLIKTIHYFLYPKGKTNENAVLKDKVVIANGGSQGGELINVPLDEVTLNTVLFPRPINDCEVYLIANLPDGLITDASDTSLDALKKLVITTNFKANATQESFIMDGQCTATITSRNKTVAAKGDVILERLAAKFTTRISVEPSFTDKDSKVWTPQVDAMRIHLDRAGNNTTMEGTFATELFDFEQRMRIGTQKEDGSSITYNVFAPFYSYPRKWDYNDDALVMYIMLPWVYQEDGTTKTENCYYKVYPGTMQLDRNSWYNLDLHIGVLGSFDEEEEYVELTTFKYKVVDWKNGYDNWNAGVNLETEILSAYYLVVEQNEYVVNNKNTFEIPFITSHECIIKDLTVTYVNFGTSDTSNPEDKPVSITPITQGTHYQIGTKDTDWVKLEGNTVKLSHTLNNDFVNTTDYDYSPYTIKFTLCHKNNQDKFKEQITITQKPAISITAHKNSLYEATNGSTKSGYMYVNSNSPNNSTSYSNFGGSNGITNSSSNKNPYMYTIEVSVLPVGSDYILGDPRVLHEFVKENDKNYDSTKPYLTGTFASAPGIENGTNRNLTKYYGTSRNEDVENTIAPKFRIASSHGVTSTIEYATAFNRAASYQEDGYPAGRWRVPTKAEVQFIIKLSSDGKIPLLFTNSSNYWCANGKVKPIKDSSPEYTRQTTGSCYIRSVYDEWYWENSQWPRMESRRDHPNKYNQFTWGDEIN